MYFKYSMHREYLLKTVLEFLQSRTFFSFEQFTLYVLLSFSPFQWRPFALTCSPGDFMQADRLNTRSPMSARETHLLYVDLPFRHPNRESRSLH